MGDCIGLNTPPSLPPNMDINTNNKDPTTENDEYLALFKDQSNGLFYGAFDKYIKFKAHHDNSLSDEELLAEAEPYVFIVSYVMAADGVDEKERDLFASAASLWTEGKMTLERANEMITEGATCKDEEVVLEKAKQLSNQYGSDNASGFNMMKSALYDALIFANGDGILHETEIERFKYVGNLWGVSQDELNELLKLFYSEQKLLQDFYRIFECKPNQQV
eukprot:907432_1